MESKKFLISFFMVMFIRGTEAFVINEYDFLTSDNDSEKTNCFQEPTVNGWSHGVSRNLSWYIHPEEKTAISTPTDFCTSSSSPFLVIIVASRPSDLEGRNFIRTTWASKEYLNSLSMKVKVAFILGLSKNEISNHLISKEAHEFGDIIQESFHDTYNNLTIKSAMMLKWVTAYCAKTKYLMKTDDDMIINIRNLLKSLSKEPNNTRLLFGYLHARNIPHLNMTSKWYAPKYLYPHPVYPKFLAGWGYVMHIEVAIELYEAALSIPIFYLEDVFFTGLCAKKAKVQPVHNSGFRRFLPRNEYRYENLITSHGIKSDKKKEVWEIMNRK